MPQSKKEIFVQAYTDYGKSLLKRSFFKVSDKALADDLVQTTFLKTWEYLVKHGKVDSMKSFLFHVLNNLIVDEYRKQKPVSLDVLTDSGFTIAIDESERLFDVIDGRTAIMLIPLLGEKYRDIINMRYVGDMALHEIAEITKQSKNTVTVQIHRGVEKLAILFRIDNERIASKK